MIFESSIQINEWKLFLEFKNWQFSNFHQQLILTNNIFSLLLLLIIIFACYLSCYLFNNTCCYFWSLVTCYLLVVTCYFLLLLINRYLLLVNYFWSLAVTWTFLVSTGAPLTVRPPLQVKRLFNVEEQQLLCRISEIEIEKEKAPASANLEAENFAAKRRSHHPGMRECFFDQWIFHSVSQRFHFKLHPAWRAVSALLTRYIFQTYAQPPVLSLAKSVPSNWITNRGSTTQSDYYEIEQKILNIARIANAVQCHS